MSAEANVGTDMDMDKGTLQIQGLTKSFGGGRPVYKEGWARPKPKADRPGTKKGAPKAATSCTWTRGFSATMPIGCTWAGGCASRRTTSRSSWAEPGGGMAGAGMGTASTSTVRGPRRSRGKRSMA